MSALLVLLLAGPLGGGVLLLLAGRRVNAAAPTLGVAVAVVTLGVAGALAAARPTVVVPLFAGVDAAFAVDGLSSVLVLTVAAVTAAVLVFSLGEFGRRENRGRFFGLMLIFAGAMLVTVTAATLPPLLMGWEVMGATSYALIGFRWAEPRRVAAATTAFLTTRAADLGLYLAAGAALAGGVASLRLDALPTAAEPWRSVLTVGVVLAAAGKSAQLPFSFWLSRAMEGPSPVSALLHSATMVAAGGYLLLRLQPLLAAAGWAEPVVAWGGALTALLLGLVAVAQRDLKQLLAASSCAQVGFIVLAAGAGGVAGGAAQLVAHAATKALLFLAAGAWLTALGTKQLPALRGAARRYRLVGVTFTVGAVSLAGIPPLSIWAAKDELLAAALRRGPALYTVGLAAAVISTVYSVKALWFLWQPAPASAEAGYDTESAGSRVVAPATGPPLVVLAGAAVLLGALAVPDIAAGLRRVVSSGEEAGPAGWQLGLSAAVALGAAALTWRRGGRAAPLPAAVGRWLGRWLDLEPAARHVLIAPTLRLAGALAAVDDRVIDGAVTAAARATAAAARAAGRFDDRGVDGAVTAVGATARRLGRLARRPQTGQLHQYYAQAAVALAALTLLVVLTR